MWFVTYENWVGLFWNVGLLRHRNLPVTCTAQNSQNYGTRSPMQRRPFTCTRALQHKQWLLNTIPCTFVLLCDSCYCANAWTNSQWHFLTNRGSGSWWCYRHIWKYLRESNILSSNFSCIPNSLIPLAFSGKLRAISCYSLLLPLCTKIDPNRSCRSARSFISTLNCT